MKIIYLVLGLIVLYLGFYFIRFEYILSRAHLPEIKQTDKALGSGTKLKYMAAGDSTAVGEGASRVEKTYTYNVATYLATKHEVEYRNVAVIGSTTSDVIEKQISQIVDYNPDIITISFGANVVTHFKNQSKIIDNYKKIISELTDKTHAKIYITDAARFDQAYLLPWSFRVYFDSQSKSVNPELLKLGSDRVKIIDIHKVDVNNSADQFHPSDIGYGFWTAAFLEQIKLDF